MGRLSDLAIFTSMLIDLTHPLQSGMTVYPGDAIPSFEPSASVAQDGFAVTQLRMSSHTGTHIDAPAHILANTKTLDHFPLEQFSGPGLVIDCQRQDQLDLAFLQPFAGAIANIEFLLFYTGWQQRWNTATYLEPFPSLTETAAKWLTQFSLKAIGLDVISVDEMGSTTVPNHKILLGAELLIVENLTQLDQLLGKVFEFSAIPLSIKQADGAPVRAFARL